MPSDKVYLGAGVVLCLEYHPTSKLQDGKHGVEFFFHKESDDLEVQQNRSYLVGRVKKMEDNRVLVTTIKHKKGHWHPKRNIVEVFDPENVSEF